MRLCRLFVERTTLSLLCRVRNTSEVLLDDIDSLWDCDFARSHTRSSSSSATRTPKGPKPTLTFAPTTNKSKAAIATQALLTAAETTAVKAKSLVDALESDTLTHSVDSKKIDKCIESLQSRLEDKYMDAYASSYADSAAGDASDLPPGGDASHPVPVVADTIDDAMSLDCLMILSVCIRAHRPTTTAIRRRLIFLNRHIDCPHQYLHRPPLAPISPTTLSTPYVVTTGAHLFQTAQRSKACTNSYGRQWRTQTLVMSSTSDTRCHFSTTTWRSQSADAARHIHCSPCLSYM